jgi:hypothetical protein
MARITALVYNCWTIFMRLGIPDKHAEAITSRPLALHGIARQTRHSNQTTVEITTHRVSSSMIRSKNRFGQHALQGTFDCQGVDEGERLSWAHQRECGAVHPSGSLEADIECRLSAISSWQGAGKYP